MEFYDMNYFESYLHDIVGMATNPTDESFVLLQRTRCDIIDDYNRGNLNDFNYRTLQRVLYKVIEDMRSYLNNSEV